MIYKVVKGQVHLDGNAVSATNIVDKLNIILDLQKMFQKHEVKTIAGNLRFLVDYFDKDDEKTGAVDKDVQDCLSKAANILNATYQKLERVK